MTTNFIRPVYFSWVYNMKYEHLVAGVCAGLASTVVLHPLDLLKLRFAVHDGRSELKFNYRGIHSAILTIIKQEGIPGLYRGIVPHVWGASISWGCYFLFYNTIKSYWQEGDANKVLPPSIHLLAAGQSGAVTLLITNPFWVIKTRMCLQTQQSQMSITPIYKYTGLLDAIVTIFKVEGVRGLYKGIFPGLLGVSHGAVQFMVYDELKNRFNKYKNVPITTKLNNSEYIIFAAISKLIASTTTYPYQVIRARLQKQGTLYTSSWHCIRETFKYESWRGFYKGLLPNLIRVTPATMITFVIYENIFNFLTRNKKNN